VSPFGLAASMFAVWCQILFVSSLVLVPLARAADQLDDVPICHAEVDGNALPIPQKEDHSRHDCVLCVLCLSGASAAVVPASVPALPARHFAARHPLDAYRPRAPPVRLVSAAQPRGPPKLI
jgi:DUF2946 family protein